jgi:hypothetical protein
MIYVLGPRDKKKIQQLKEFEFVMTTSNSSAVWSKGLSPFYLGPVNLFNGYVARNVENGWQFSKVYKEHMDNDGNPSPEYFKWAKLGWSDKAAHRYPMGKGVIPEYSYWDGEKLGYVAARKKIYVPLYIRAVAKSEALKVLIEKHRIKPDICLWDFDAYDHRELGMSYEDVLNDPARKMGHAFVLAMLLECKDKILGMLNR